ncbi:MAG: hypothetical protein ACE5JL_10285 [Dehalococcoidia bacterium]
MVEVIWSIMFAAMMGLAGVVGLLFMVVQGGHDEPDVKLWCSKCNKKQLFRETRLRERTGPRVCRYCRHPLMVPQQS